MDVNLERGQNHGSRRENKTLAVSSLLRFDNDPLSTEFIAIPSKSVEPLAFEPIVFCDTFDSNSRGRFEDDRRDRGERIVPNSSSTLALIETLLTQNDFNLKRMLKVFLKREW